MCDECRQNPCANTCPNNPDFYKRHYEPCLICEQEYDEEELDYHVCESCRTRYRTFETALEYGKVATDIVMVNGLFAKLLTPDQINEALKAVAIEVYKYYPAVANRAAKELTTEDDSHFIDWLVKQKNR